MTQLEQREIVLKHCWHYLGTAYTWGGDDSGSFDCSGAVVMFGKAIGVLPRKGDWTADSLMNLFPRIHRVDLLPADLVFWCNYAGRATHVGIVADPVELYFGAEGGGRWATNPAEAIRRNAFFKMRPIDSRGLPEERRYVRMIPVEG